jgi:PilZ domain
MHLIPIHEVQEQHLAPAPTESAAAAPLATSVTPGSRASVTSVHAASATAPVFAPSRPRGIARVPTHTVGHARERRAYVRANLILPLALRSVAGRTETELTALSTQDISSSGIFFLCPRKIEPGTPVEMEVMLVEKPSGRGSVRMRTQACIVRAEESGVPGCYGLAAAFDDITFIRDEPFPPKA